MRRGRRAEPQDPSGPWAPDRPPGPPGAVTPAPRPPPGAASTWHETTDNARCRAWVPRARCQVPNSHVWPAAATGDHLQGGRKFCGAARQRPPDRGHTQEVCVGGLCVCGSRSGGSPCFLLGVVAVRSGEAHSRRDWCLLSPCWRRESEAEGDRGPPRSRGPRASTGPAASLLRSELPANTDRPPERLVGRRERKAARGR